MTNSLTVVGDMVNALSNIHESVELRDPGGKLLGVFVPRAEMESFRTGVKSPFSPEEIRRRAQEPGGTSLEAFWRRMKSEPGT